MAGPNVLRGGAGHDQLYGGAGNDRLDGGEHQDLPWQRRADTGIGCETYVEA